MTLHPKLRVFLELGRVSNLPSALTNVTTGWLLAGGRLDLPLVWLWLGATLIFLAGMTLNDAADSKWDAERKPDRPVPSGRISKEGAWALGLGEMAVAIAFFWLAGASLFWIGAITACILGYNLYHKEWTGSVWVMAGCRFFLCIIGASAFGQGSGVVVYVLFSAAVLAAYVAGITIMARAEASGVQQPWHEYALLLAPVLTLFWSPHWQTLLLLLMQTGFVVAILKKVRDRSLLLPAAVGWLLAGIVLVDAVAISALWFWVALAFAALTFALRHFQRWIAAT